MISAPELRSVVDDIKRVAEGNYDNTSDGEEEEEEAGSDGTQNSFGGRAYDIDRLHAEDARDKVFVAILKALVARHNRPSSPKELATCIMKNEFTMLGGATPYATVSSRISQHFKRIFDQVPPRPPILGRVAHEKHTRKYFYYVASAAEQDAFHRKVRAGLIPTQPMPLVPPPSSTRKKPRCMVPAAAVEPDHHQSATAQRRSLSRRAVSVEVSEQPTAHRSTRSRTQPRLQKQEKDEEEQQLATETRPRRTSYDGGCVRRRRLRRRTNEEDERGENAQEREEEDEDEDEEDANPYARKRYRSVRSAVAQAYPRRRSRRPAAPPANDAAAEEREEDEEEGVPAAGKWRRHDQQQLLDVTMDGSEPLVDGGDIDGDLGAVLLLDSIFGNESPTVAASSAKDDLAAVVATDLLAPGIDDSVVPLTCSATSAGEQLDSPASPASLLLHNNNRHTTTPADLSPRLLSISTGSSVATTAVDYDFSFHDLMDAELMSVNELENLWATSNPADEHAAVSPSPPPPPPPPITPSLPLATIRETSDSDDVATTATTAAASDALPSRLTQRLLALSATTSLSSQQLAKPAPLSLLSLSSAPPSLSSACSALVDSVEPTAALVENTSEHTSEHKELVESAPDGDDDDGEEESALEHKEKEAAEGGGGSKVILPDPFGDIAASAMVATKVAVSPRVVLTIVETVPVYMTVVTTTEPAGAQQGKWLVRRHRLLRLVENGYVNASSLLLAGGVASEQERSIVLSLEVGRFKWRRPQSKLYGTWIPLPRARALAATCSLNHRLGPFLNDNLEAYFPAPLPTSFVRHVITPFFEEQQQQSKAEEFQSLVSAVSAHHNHSLHPPQAISRSSTFGATARGTPSPSIIQALSRAPSLSAAAAAAKAIFASDDRHLQSLLQLLSADGPMLVPGSTASGSEPVSEAVAGSVPAVSEAAAPESESEAAAPPLLGDGGGDGGGGGVDAARLSDAIASTLAQEEEGEKEEEEEEEEEEKEEEEEEERLDLSMEIAEHDMICSSTPPSPPPPPAPESKRKMPLRSVASARGAAGLNARLAQTMEAFGLTGAAKASMLLRLRAAAAATSTGHPLAVAPYLLYNTTAKHRRAEDLADGRTRKRARVMRVARCKPGTEPPAESSADAAPAAAAHPKRLVDAAAILRVACAIYSQKLNADTQPPPPPPPPPPPLPPPPPSSASVVSSSASSSAGLVPQQRPQRPHVRAAAGGSPQRPPPPPSAPPSLQRPPPHSSLPQRPVQQQQPGRPPRPPQSPLAAQTAASPSSPAVAMARRPASGFTAGRPPVTQQQQPRGPPLRRPPPPPGSSPSSANGGRPPPPPHPHPQMRPSPMRPSPLMRPPAMRPANGLARPRPMSPLHGGRPPFPHPHPPLRSPAKTLLQQQRPAAAAGGGGSPLVASSSPRPPTTPRAQQQQQQQQQRPSPP